MTLHLTADDTRRLADAAEALLSPLAGPDPDAWWRSAERCLRAVFPGANVMLAAPDGPRLHRRCESIDHAVLRRFDAFVDVDPRTGRPDDSDPDVKPWHAHRRRQRVEVWTYTESARLLAAAGVDAMRVPFYAEGLVPAGLRAPVVLTPALPGHADLFLTVGYPRPGRSRFGGDVGDAAVLRLLLPAFRAAHHTYMTFAARRQALAATVDAGDGALLVVAADGRTLHQSAALRRLLAAEPERERLLARMAAMAAECGTFGRRGRPTLSGRALTTRAPGAGPLAPRASDVVATAFARYDVRAAFGSPLLWGAEGVVEVWVRALDDPLDDPLDPAPDERGAAGPPERAADAPGAGRGDARLTPREAEVARLLARRATDAEVAAALGVSRYTARHHAERVLRKLGVHSRREVAAVLRADGPARR